MTVFFNIKEYNDHVEKTAASSAFKAIFAVYMFSMEGCPPCRSTIEMLFGNGAQLEYSVWSVILKKVREELPKIIKIKLENKILKDDVNSILIKNAITKHSIEKIVEHMNSNIDINFVKFMRDSHMNIIEQFNISGFPSFTMCLQSKNHNIISKKNPIPVKTGGFMGTGMFAQWLNHNIEILLELYMDTLLIDWIKMND